MRYLPLLLLFMLPACDNFGGNPNAWGHRVFASDEALAKARDEQGRQARLLCEQQGYTGQGLHACIQNAVNR